MGLSKMRTSFLKSKNNDRSNMPPSRKEFALVKGPILKVCSVSKMFKQSNILSLQDVNFEVNREEFLCVFGPNGCGKSTLLNLIAGFEPYFPPTIGEVHVNGTVTSGPSSDRAMVFQEESLFPWLDAQGNIEFGLKIMGVPKAERHKISEHYLKLMGLEEFRDKHPFELSGGMKQKTELARALALKPKILLLDEPFAQVDALTRLSLQEELLRVSELEKITVIFVTHSIQEALLLGDRICIMTKRPGKIKETVSVEFPKPRKMSDLINDKRFPSLRNHIVRIVQEEGFGNGIP
jgi:NitT/TauT family transport system ATP-binding protein